MDRIHGGVPTSFQATAGRLSYLKLTCTGATFLTGDANVPGSDLELVLKTIGTRATVVISNASAETILHVAIENAGSWDVEGDGTYTELESAVNAASTNISAVTVVTGAFGVI
jgi:hypothetical protein